MSGHVVPVWLYVAIFLALLVLTATTVQVAFVDLGTFHHVDLNTLAALTIAVVKMLLVVLFFMHVRTSSSLTRVVIAAGFFWLLLLMAFTLTDEFSRWWDDRPSGWGAATSAPSSR
jgi:cytochrome c oxidase subunit IV